MANPPGSLDQYIVDRQHQTPYRHPEQPDLVCVWPDALTASDGCGTIFTFLGVLPRGFLGLLLTDYTLSKHAGWPTWAVGICDFIAFGAVVAAEYGLVRYFNRENFLRLGIISEAGEWDRWKPSNTSRSTIYVGVLPADKTDAELTDALRNIYTKEYNPIENEPSEATLPLIIRIFSTRSGSKYAIIHFENKDLAADAARETDGFKFETVGRIRATVNDIYAPHRLFNAILAFNISLVFAYLVRTTFDGAVFSEKAMGVSQWLALITPQSTGLINATQSPGLQSLFFVPAFLANYPAYLTIQRQAWRRIRYALYWGVEKPQYRLVRERLESQFKAVRRYVSRYGGSENSYGAYNNKVDWVFGNLADLPAGWVNQKDSAQDANRMLTALAILRRDLKKPLTEPTQLHYKLLALSGRERIEFYRRDTSTLKSFLGTATVHAITAYAVLYVSAGQGLWSFFDFSQGMSKAVWGGAEDSIISAFAGLMGYMSVFSLALDTAYPLVRYVLRRSQPEWHAISGPARSAIVFATTIVCAIGALSHVEEAFLDGESWNMLVDAGIAAFLIDSYGFGLQLYAWATRKACKEAPYLAFLKEVDHVLEEATWLSSLNAEELLLLHNNALEAGLAHFPTLTKLPTQYYGWAESTFVKLGRWMRNHPGRLAMALMALFGGAAHGAVRFAQIVQFFNLWSDKKPGHLNPWFNLLMGVTAGMNLIALEYTEGLEGFEEFEEHYKSKSRDEGLSPLVAARHVVKDGATRLAKDKVAALSLLIAAAVDGMLAGFHVYELMDGSNKTSQQFMTGLLATSATIQYVMASQRQFLSHYDLFRIFKIEDDYIERSDAKLKAVCVALIVNLLAAAGAFVMFSLSFESNFSIMESLLKDHWGAQKNLAKFLAYFLATPLSFIYAGADYLLYGAAMRKFIMDPEQRDVVSMLAGRKIKNGKYLRPYIMTCIFPIILAIFGSGLVSFSALDDASKFWLGRSSIHPYGWLMGLLAFNRVVQNIFTEGYGFQKFVFKATRNLMGNKKVDTNTIITWVIPVSDKELEKITKKYRDSQSLIKAIDEKYHVHGLDDKSYFLRSLMLLVAEVGFVIGLRAIIKYGLIHRDELTLEEEYLSYSFATFASVVLGHAWLVSGQYAADRVGLPKWLRGLNYLPTMGLPVVAGVAMQEFMTSGLRKGGVKKHDAENTADYVGAIVAGVVAVTWDHVSHKLFLHPLNKFFSAVGRKCKSWWGSLCGGSSSDSLDDADEEAVIANSSSSSSSSYQEITELTGGVALQSPTNPLINSESEPTLVIASDTASINGFSGNTNNQGESTPLLSDEAASIADSSRISPQ